MLEYARVFIWPVLVVIGVAFFYPEVHEIIKNGGWSVGPVKVEQRIDVLSKTLQEQLIAQKDFATKIQENSADQTKVKDYAGRLLQNITTSQQGLSKDVDELKAAIPDRQASTNNQESQKSDSPETAQDWELKGFNALVAKDVDNAVSSFAQAEAIWPDYHNVAEIRSLLVSKREALKDPKSSEWRLTLQKVLSDYSWGMPADVREKLKAQT